ncbi:hypothetical protein J2S74_001293 [Evansella vedderi]|uniref:Replication protein n=1 Tax=Evansella vedderi TaxID=38282 RepID=A0ABT9ZRR1_9BACI|nr:hypothetical protein [Evansella vedderi]MDQ0253921.1 hypothetical protein [Evansella vedderi]
MCESFNEFPLLLRPQLAVKIGLNEAIILQQIYYWNELNKKTGKNYKVGYYWTYNSYEEWKEQFPFWSTSTIKRIMESLEVKKLIVTGNYNKLKIDRRKWYRVNYPVLEALEKIPLDQIDLTNLASWYDHLSTLNLPLPETKSKNTSRTNNKENGAMKHRPMLSFHEFIQNHSVDDRTINVIQCYLTKFKEHRKKEHRNLKTKQWEEIVSNMFYVIDEHNGQDFDLSELDVVNMIHKHFETKYYGKCDYNILHFMNHRIRVKRTYEVIV